MTAQHRTLRFGSMEDAMAEATEVKRHALPCRHFDGHLGFLFPVA
jgi:hypothetical protein